jgi:hypothetical protein
MLYKSVVYGIAEDRGDGRLKQLEPQEKGLQR